MSRKSNRQTGMRARIAATAARIMAEDGIEDFGSRQAQAARRLGAPEAQALPGNDEIEAELRSYRALYQAEEHPLRIAELRRMALDAMRALQRFNPYLTGPVLKGIAGRYAEIELQLFPESAKDVELFLLDSNLAYTTHECRRFSGIGRTRSACCRCCGAVRRSSCRYSSARRAACAEDLAGRPRDGPRRHRGGRGAPARWR